MTCTTRDCATCPLLTRDHFTPRCIALKVLGWSYQQTNRPANIQYLTEPCHIEKDKNTEDRYKQSVRQFKGEFIAFGEHVT